MIEAIKASLQSMVLRAKVATSVISGRTLIQANALDDDTHDLVELLHPFGWVANPVAGADVVEVQIAGQASHKVLLGGDHTSDTIPLKRGECGISRGGQLVVVRVTGVNIVTPLMQWGMSEAALNRLVTEKFEALFNAHTHPTPSGQSSPPSQQMTSAHLTGGS